MAVSARSLTSAPIQQWPSNVVMHEQARVLTDIYQPDINIAVWQRTFTAPLTSAIDQFLHFILRVKSRLQRLKTA